MTTETNVELHRVLGATLREHVLTERSRNLGIEDTLLLEQRECVSVQHLSPLVTIVTSSITTREDVRERGSHTRTLNLGNNLRRLHRCLLECLNITRIRLRQAMPSHIGHTERQLTNVRISSQIVLGINDLRDQLGRHLLARLVMYCPQIEVLLLGSPILQQLRRQLNEITIDARTGQRRILTLAQHTVQRVAELVQEGGKFVEGQQRRSALGRLGEVHYQRNQRTDLVALGVEARGTELGHPRTTTLGLAGEEIEVENCHHLTRSIINLVSGYLGVINRDLGVLLELQTVELGSQHKYTLLHVVELQVGLNHLVAQSILLILVLLAVIAEIPGHYLALQAKRLSVCVDSCIVLIGILLRSVQQTLQEVIYILSALGHTLLQNIVSIGSVTKQVSHLQAQLGDTLNDLAVVVCTLGQRTRVVGTPQLLLQLTVRRVGHKRTIARSLQRYSPTLLATSLSVSSQTLLNEIGQLGNNGRVGDVIGVGIGCSQHILTKLQGQLRQFSRDLTILCLLLVVQCCTATCEALIGLFEQLSLFERQIERLALIIYSLHTSKQLGIERHIVRVLGQLGLHLHRHLLHLLVSICLQNVEEDILNASQFVACALQSLDRICERGSSRIGYDSVDLGTSLSNSRVECGCIVFNLDLVERRRLVGSIPISQQRIGALALTSRKSCKCHSSNQNLFFHSVLSVSICLSFRVNTDYHTSTGSCRTSSPATSPT